MPVRYRGAGSEIGVGHDRRSVAARTLHSPPETRYRRDPRFPAERPGGRKLEGVQVHFLLRISALRFWVTGGAARRKGKSFFEPRFPCWNPGFPCARCAFGSPPAQRLRELE